MSRNGFYMAGIATSATFGALAFISANVHSPEHPTPKPKIARTVVFGDMQADPGLYGPSPGLSMYIVVCKKDDVGFYPVIQKNSDDWLSRQVVVFCDYAHLTEKSWKKLSQEFVGRQHTPQTDRAHANQLRDQFTKPLEGKFTALFDNEALAITGYNTDPANPGAIGRVTLRAYKPTWWAPRYANEF